MYGVQDKGVPGKDGKVLAEMHGSERISNSRNFDPNVSNSNTIHYFKVDCKEGASFYSSKLHFQRKASPRLGRCKPVATSTRMAEAGISAWSNISQSQKGFWEESWLCDWLMRLSIRRGPEPDASRSDHPIAPLLRRHIEAIADPTAGMWVSPGSQVPRV